MSYQIQPLESFRLGRYQLPIPCYLCNHDNLYDAPLCRHCTAPLDLARSFAETQVRPQIWMTLGADGVGKSVFLGTLLDILSRQRSRTEFLTNDAASIVIQKEVMAALARQEFPDRTSPRAEDWRWAHCRLHRRTRKEPLSVFFVDLAGSAILREIETPHSFPVIRGLFEKSTGVFLVMDAARIQAGDKDEEFFAMEIMSHLSDMRARQRPTSPSPTRRTRFVGPAMPPVAIALAKGDQCPACFDNPRDFATGQLPGVVRCCEELLSQFEFFGVSAVGGVATVKPPSGPSSEVPLRVEPRGILEPFRWLVRNVTPS
ncbi:MAG TPA: hypothetical protein VIY86_02815 [Pirellulaceae bacterium]